MIRSHDIPTLSIGSVARIMDLSGEATFEKKRGTKMLKRLRLIGMLMIFLLVAPTGWALDTLINWETPHVHPLELTPSGSLLLAVNTPDARLEVFDVTTGMPVHVGAIPVGLDPVAVRARTNSEVWVVNHISDTVSIVDLTTMNVVATLHTADEPADVVFAGSGGRAFVSCSQANRVQVFDPADLSAPPIELPIAGEDPRARAVSPDGSEA
ncbi:MAG: hypothetical protein IIB61_02030 [Planctomycetes bacterium]|nr:hypothetical protein [Planctomycetota bacterium]